MEDIHNTYLYMSALVRRQSEDVVHWLCDLGRETELKFSLGFSVQTT
jgi:hypothetical protein